MQTLTGKKIIVTRAQDQVNDFCDIITKKGGIPILMPGIRTTPFYDNPELIKVYNNINEYDWLIFTSSNAAKYFFKKAGELGITNIDLKIAAVGASTERYIEKLGYDVHVMPDEYLAENIKNHLGKIKNKKILIPHANIAGKALIKSLREAGALVKGIILYHTEKIKLSEEQKQIIHNNNIDYITFASSSAAEAFLSSLDSDTILPQTKIVCIGPRTANTVTEMNFNADIVANPYTVGGMIAAIEKDVNNLSI
jgi:uroporphyrinogen III methyltransferase / synthase